MAETVGGASAGGAAGGTGYTGQAGANGGYGGGGGGGAGGGAGGDGAGLIRFIADDGFPDFSTVTVVGGSGGTPDGRDGQSAGGAGGSGGGGQGGQNGQVISSGGSVNLASNVTGGNGGNGGAGNIGESSGGWGGGGGAGGFGLVITTFGVQVAVNTTISGGRGGNGGSSDGGDAGTGGGGGGGIFIANTASNVKIENSGIVQGGTGGNFASGGDGIAGANLTIINSGSIVGGLAGGNGARANAVTFQNGTNTFEFQGGTVTGNVVANGTNDTYQLGGSAGGTFDASLIGTQYLNFEHLGSTGTGTWTLIGTNASTQSWSASSGTLLVDGTMTNTTFSVGNGATLGGSGTVGAVTVQSGGAVNPGNSSGIFNTGNFSITSGTLTIEIAGTTVGSQYDQMNVTGTVSLGGTLNLSLINPFVPTVGNSFIIINNDASDLVTGTFAGLDQGATFTIGGQLVQISYTGGTGNDVVLTAISNNTAPTLGANNVVAINEGATTQLSGNALRFQDVEQGPAHITYTVTSGPTNGTLFKNGSPVAVNGTFTQDDLNNNRLTFTHNGSETTNASFGFSVSDGAGATVTNQAFSFTINPVNDAPTLTVPSPTILEDGTLSLSGLSVQDVDDAGENYFLSVTAPSGTFLLQGQPVGSSFTESNNLAGIRSMLDSAYTFTPDANFNGSLQISVELYDASFNQITSQNFTLNITPVNDAPTLTGDLTATVNEGSTVVLTAADLGFSDPDDIASGITFTVSNVTNGSVLVEGRGASSFTATQLAAGQVRFQHNDSETTSASFDVSVEDGNEDVSTPVSSVFTVSVTPVDDTILTHTRGGNGSFGGAGATGFSGETGGFSPSGGGGGGAAGGGAGALGGGGLNGGVGGFGSSPNGAPGGFGTSTGGGGQGGSNGAVGVLVDHASSGGNGGAGGSGDLGGGGGAGGFGYVVTGTGAIDNQFSITGGIGGNGGSGRTENSGGSAGSGGGGILFTEAGVTFTNSGTVTGGAGGTRGGNQTFSSSGNGGDAVTGHDLSIINTGSLAGGTGGIGAATGYAVWFSSGTNSFEHQVGGSVTGIVLADGTADTFTLGGTTNGTFDASLIGTGAQYQGFESLATTGSATWTLTGTSTTTAGLSVGGTSTLIVNGSLANSAVTVEDGGTLGGTGTVGAVSVEAGGSLAPGNNGVGTLTAESLDLTSSTLKIEIGGLGSFDQVVVHGNVTLGGALDVSFLNNYDPEIGDGFMIIDHRGSDQVQGTFAGLGHLQYFTVGNETFRISYSALDGNDVRITVTEARSLIVTTLDDVVNAFDGVTSLREAINFANDTTANGGTGDADNNGNANDTITFASGLNGVIYLDGGDGAGGAAGSELVITAATTIDGDGRITISGDAGYDDEHVDGSVITDVEASLTGDNRLDDNSRIFRIDGINSNTTLEGLTLTGGRTTADEEGGGAVYSFGQQLTMLSSTLAGNSTDGNNSRGGAVFVNSDLVTIDSTFSGNSTAGDGSGGGAAYAKGINATNSTFSGNSTSGSNANGGALASTSTTLLNSTLTGNSVGAGSNGVVSGSSFSSTNSVILGNSGPGGSELSISVGGRNLSGNNIIGTDVYSSSQDIGDTTAAAVFEALDANGGGTLADNGGPVQTVALKASTTNPAIDGSINSTLTTDARGFTAFDAPNTGASGAGAAVRDLGAFEFVNAAPTKPADKNAAANSIAENSAANSLVGITASSTDGDGQTLTYSLTNDAGGAFKIDSTTGVVSVADASKLDYEALGPSHSLSITVSASDGFVTSTETFTINVTDVGEAATISGTKTGAVAEDGTLKASGTLTVQDVDAGQAKFQTPSSLAGTYGTFTFDADTGQWTYDLNNTALNVQSLKATDTVTDTLTVTSSDGTATETITVTISGKNDAPTGAPTAVLGAGTEDTTYSVKASDLLQGFSDIDGDRLTIASISVNHGTLTSGGGGKGDPDYIFTPDANYNGLVTLTYSVTDGTVSLANKTQTFTLTSVNDAPSGANKTITTNEDTAYTFKAADFGFSDIDGNALKSVKISSLPTKGTLTLNGAAVIANQVIAAVDITKLVFTPAANANGAGYANINFFVQDTGGTTNGGLDTDASANTITLNVTAVNDAPTAVVASNVRGPIAENASTAAAIKFADLDITDVDGGNNVLSLSGADASLFQILNGDLYLKAGAKLDFETNPKLDVTVIVNDASVGGAIDAQKALSFSVTDIIESYIGTSKANVLTGTASDETFIGNGGADKMTGGGGRDTFVFKTLTDTAAGSPSFITNPTIAWQSGLGLRDVITDFTPGNDKIDLSLIDASTKLAGNQAFAFNGTGAFSSNPGSLIYRVFDLAGTANDRTIVYADVNGDRLADMQIELTGLKALQATDFVL